MAFQQRRGRPRLNKPKKDIGTPELRLKKTLDLTTEAIDLCFKRGIITIEQNEAAIRFRWLYTLRFGAPDISSYNPENTGKSCFRQDNEDWLYARHYEYGIALNELDKIHARRILMNICIFNQRPSFLKTNCLKIDSKTAKKHSLELSKLCEGLDLLSKLLGKKTNGATARKI